MDLLIAHLFDLEMETGDTISFANNSTFTIHYNPIWKRCSARAINDCWVEIGLLWFWLLPWWETCGDGTFITGLTTRKRSPWSCSQISFCLWFTLRIFGIFKWRNLLSIVVKRRWPPRHSELLTRQVIIRESTYIYPIHQYIYQFLIDIYQPQ